MKSLSYFYLFLIWVIIRKNIPSFPQTMNRGIINVSQKKNHTFYWHPPSMMQMKVSHYYNDVILHFTKSRGMNKPDRYLPMRESEFAALLSMVDEINKQIKKTKKIAGKERQYLDDESDNNFTQVPLPPMQKKGQTNVLHPAVIPMILQVVVKKLLKAQTSGKDGAKSLNLQRKRKQKKMEKENDLVGSSQGSDSQLSEAEDK